MNDERVPLRPGEILESLAVGFRTCGCYPLTGGAVSSAQSIWEVIVETLSASGSERQGRMIDKDGSSAMDMEDKK